MRDRSQQVHLLNSGLLSPWRGGLLETTPAEALLGPTLPLSFADCREEDVGKNVPDCFGEVPPQVGSRPRCPWEDPWVVVGTHRPPTGLFCPPHVGTHDGAFAPVLHVNRRSSLPPASSPSSACALALACACSVAQSCPTL